MNLIMCYLLFIAAALYGWHMLQKNIKRKERELQIRDERLIDEAGKMFPECSTRIEALDKLYQHKYREMLTLKREDNPEWEIFFSLCMRIFNERNRLINESVEFESQFRKITRPKLKIVN